MKDHTLRSFHLIFLGITAVCAQTIFTRELMTLFSGTEFVIGLILAAWLFWIGVGGVIGGRTKGLKDTKDFRGFFVLSIAVSVLLPLTVLAIRFGRAVMVDPPGSLPSIGKAALFSVLVQAPFCFIYGHLYNVTSSIWVGASGSISRSVSRVYIYEAVGSTAGALIFSFAMIPLLPQMLVAVIVAVAMMMIAFVVPFSGRKWFLRRLLPAAVMGTALIVSLQDLDRWTIQRIFHGYQLEGVFFSRYGEIVLTTHREVMTVFSQGARLLSVPEPERAEEAVHIPMAMHPAPRFVLMIGGGLGGGVEEVLKYGSLERVDYIEIDRKILQLRDTIDSFLLESVPDSALNGLRLDSRKKVRFIHADGRFFLKEKRGGYDVVIMNTPPPLNLQLNRFYTVEFFEEVKKSLKEGGVFSFSHPSSENFLTSEQAEIIGSLERTLNRVFPHVLVLPGDTAHFIASDRVLSSELIVANLERRGIETRYMNRNYLPFRFSEERVSFLESALRRTHFSRVNTDTYPFVSFLEFLLEARRAGFSGTHVFSRLLRLDRLVVFFVSLALLSLIALLPRGETLMRAGVWSIGLTSFIIQILILLQFQSFSGLLYHAFVLLTAVFMVGASSGAYAGLSYLKDSKVGVGVVHGIFAVFSLLLIGVVELFAVVRPAFPVGFGVFMFLSFTSGFMTGVYYQLVVRMGFSKGGRKVPAEYYAWDLFGACVGGFVGGVFFFPLLGVVWTAALLLLINVLLGVVVSKRIGVSLS